MNISASFLSMAAVAALVCPAFAQELKPAYDLVARVTPDSVKLVEFAIDKSVEGFTLEKKGGKLLITAPSINHLTAGYGYFLREFQKAHFSWNGDRLPKAINPDLIKEKVSVPKQWDWRYAYNYCTLTYTSAFWGEKEWTKELDMLALNGFNYALVQAGLEKTWVLTLRELGYPEDRIKAFIPNPAAAAWWNMGNLEGFGGPLSDKVIENEARLGRFIADRMRALGITPVLQGFVGLVPHDLENYYKKDDARYIPQGQWVAGFVRPAVLDPTTPAFQKVAEVWYRKLHEVYGGKTTFYGGDLFHEGGRSGGINVTDAAGAVQKAMQTSSPGSSWLLQAWHGNPSAALLKGLDKEKLMVLALTRDMHAGNEGKNRQGYQGAPWTWCELLNFGGNHDLYGGLKMLGGLDKLQESPDKSNLKGLGLLSEGTETNPVFYELFFQRFWMPKDRHMDHAAVQEWLASYAENRYGQSPEEVVNALKSLEKSVYSPDREQEGCTESILCARPGRNVQKASTWASGTMYYDPADVREAALGYIAAARKHPRLMEEETFRYDLVDVTRQFLTDLARPLLAATMQAYDEGNKKEYTRLSGIFLSMMKDMDALLGTYKQWRFGEMYERALAKGSNRDEKENMALACKRLVTTWSTNLSSLNDYSNRQLQGLMGDYYKRRWEIFFKSYGEALEGKIPAGEVEARFRKEVEPFEQSWQKESKPYSSQPVGDSLKGAEYVMKKYAPIAKELEHITKANRGVQWTLKDGAAELSFDVSDIIMSAGTYTASFQWERGASALQVSKVALYEGEKLVSEDVHEGWTGVENKQNVYTLKVPTLRKNLDAYIIKAQVKGASGNDSSGKMIFKKK